MSEELYELHYRRPGDVWRVKRSTEGTTRRFTRAEGCAFLARNGERYPEAKLVPFERRKRTVRRRKRKKKLPSRRRRG